MSNQQITPQLAIKKFFEGEAVKKKFAEVLGKKSTGFITSVMSVVNSNKLLQGASPESIYAAAAVAATLDLPVNPNLGYAWIVPYKAQAQFQIGWKGIIQLAHRTAQYERINVVPVYASQFVSYNTMTEELVLKEGEETGDPVGYAAYFRLKNQFEKTKYWPREKVLKHARRYSKSFDNGPWKTHFDEMACKTVLKNTLSQYGQLSVEMQQAIAYDQAVIKPNESGDPVVSEYVDAVDLTEQKEIAPVSPFAETLSYLETVADVQKFILENPECPGELGDKRIAEIEANEAGK